MNMHMMGKTRNLSPQDLQRYFNIYPQKSSFSSGAVVVVLVLLVLVPLVCIGASLILYIIYLALSSWINFIILSIVGVALVIGLIKLFKRRRKVPFPLPLVPQPPPPPTDEEYEAWVKSWSKSIQQYGMKKLGLDSSDILGKSLYVRSIVWPRSHGAKHYYNCNCPILTKQGIDGRPHGSVNRFTFFFPAEHYIAVFTGDVNALGTVRFEETRMYYYKDIVGIETSAMALDDGMIIYPMQRFELRVSSGQSIGAATYVEDLDVEQTVNALRTLLRDKKYTN